MADNRVLTDAGQFALQFQRMAAMIRCAMPGVIVSFDPGTQRASVKPGVKMKIVQEEVSYIDLPTIQNVPVVIPYGFEGKVLLTFPIKAGDPCLLVFSDRAIDNFLQTGQSENPGASQNEDTTTPRAHHLSDAMCIPGLIAAPQVVPDWNQENIELRDFERKNYITLGAEYGIRFTTAEGFDNGGADIRMKDGNIWLYAQEYSTRFAQTWSEQPPTPTGGTRGPTMPE